MKKGFSLVELIISISLVSAIILFAVIAIKTVNPTYADPYEEMRTIIADATNLYLNTNEGLDLKNELQNNKSITLNSDLLIHKGFLEEKYYIENLKENRNIENLTITVSLDDEGFISYSINID